MLFFARFHDSTPTLLPLWRARSEPDRITLIVKTAPSIPPSVRSVISLLFTQLRTHRQDDGAETLAPRFLSATWA